MIGICIHTSVDFSIQLAFFGQFGSFHIFHVSTFGDLLFKFIFRKVQVLYQVCPSTVRNIIEGLMDLSLSVFLFG
jgi:hypothetical protein